VVARRREANADQITVFMKSPRGMGDGSTARLMAMHELSKPVPNC
jgi:hypothetical protein